VRVAVDGGPTLRFGAPIRLAAKWAAAARVLADTPGAAAASIDLRIPERPTASYDEGGAPAQSAAPPAPEVQAAAAAAVAEQPAVGATGATGPAAPVP